MRWRWFPHLSGLITPVSSLVGLWLGGWWMGLTLILLLAIYPLLDTLLGFDEHTDPLQEGLPYNIILHLHGVLVPLTVCVLLWRISVDGLTSFTALGILSVGLSSGASGIVSAHELGHRKPRSGSWWLARLSLFSVLYLHFTTEHNHTHHKHWAKKIDPTSSPLGRSVYRHFITTIPLQVRGAYRARPVDTRRSLMIEFVFLFALYAVNPEWLVAFIGQAFIAVFLLEFVNFLQHHGLSREDGERAGAQHAWESRHRLSRWTLLELPLHPAHHMKSSTPYHHLKTHDDAPQLPHGYYVMFLLALVPPLFNRSLRNRV